MRKVTKANIIFTSLILIYLIMIFSIRLIPSKYLSYNVILVMPEAVLLLTTIVVGKMLRLETLSSIPFNKVSFSTCIKSVVMAFCMIPLISVINMFSSMIDGNRVESTLNTTAMRNPLWLSLLLIAFIPAFVEEFIFRGVLFGAYKKRNPFYGMLLSAFLFGLMHMNINQFAYAFAIGFVFAMVTYATGSIVTTMIMHFIINGNSVVLSYVLTRLTEGINETSSAIDTKQPEASQMVMVISTIMMIFVFVIIPTILAVLLFISICKENRGTKSMIAVFRKTMINMRGDEAKLIDGYLILGIGTCVLYMFYNLIR